MLPYTIQKNAECEEPLTSDKLDAITASCYTVKGSSKGPIRAMYARTPAVQGRGGHIPPQLVIAFPEGPDPRQTAQWLAHQAAMTGRTMASG